MSLNIVLKISQNKTHKTDGALYLLANTKCGNKFSKLFIHNKTSNTVQSLEHSTVPQDIRVYQVIIS